MSNTRCSRVRGERSVSQGQGGGDRCPIAEVDDKTKASVATADVDKTERDLP